MNPAVLTERSDHIGAAGPEVLSSTTNSGAVLAGQLAHRHTGQCHFTRIVTGRCAAHICGNRGERPDRWGAARDAAPWDVRAGSGRMRAHIARCAHADQVQAVGQHHAGSPHWRQPRAVDVAGFSSPCGRTRQRVEAVVGPGEVFWRYRHTRCGSRSSAAVATTSS